MTDDLTREELAELRSLRKRNDDFFDRHGALDPTIANALAQATFRWFYQLLDMAERCEAAERERDAWKRAAENHAGILTAEDMDAQREEILNYNFESDGKEGG